MSDPAAPAQGIARFHQISLVGLLSLGALAALIAFQPQWLSPVQSAWFDALQRRAPRAMESAPAVIVAIDETSLQQLGQWPWPRTLLAQLVRDIERLQPAAIGIDILMPEPDRLSPERLLEQARQHDPVLASHLDPLPSNDAELAAAIEAGPVVLGLVGTHESTGRILRTPPFTVYDPATRKGTSATVLTVGQFAGALPSIEELDRVASGHGLMSVTDPAKAVIRNVPLVASIDGTLAPALSVEMLRVALHVASLRLQVHGSAVEALSIGRFIAPTERDGSMRIYYSPRDARRYITATDVLAGKVDPLAVRDKLVLVAITGLALTDYQNTPLGDAMPGSEIHAQLMENLLDESWLTRPSHAPALEVAAFVLLGLLLVWITPRWKPLYAALVALGCVALLALVAFLAFRSQRQLWDAATPGAGLMILFGVLLMLTLADAVRRRSALERIVQRQRVQAAYIAGELEAAQRIQTGILPRADSLCDEHRIDLAASMTPAREVGGDLYDFFRLDADRLFFMIGDVAGKGLSASIFMVISKSLYKSTSLRRPVATIDEMMRAANREVSRDNPEMFFVTVFAGIVDLASGRVTYCNAGHENPYLIDPATPRLLCVADGAGPPLCTVEGFAYDAGHLTMRPGELLCMVTDGVVDALDPSGQRYGSARLAGVLEGLRGDDVAAQTVVDAVRADLRSFVGAAEAADDVTVLALRLPAHRRAPA